VTALQFGRAECDHDYAGVRDEELAPLLAKPRH